MTTVNAFEVLCFVRTGFIGLLFLSRSNNSNIKLLLHCNCLNVDTLLLHRAAVLHRPQKNAGYCTGLLGLLFSVTLVQWDYCSSRQEVLCTNLNTRKVLLAPGGPCATPVF